ncbi:unnamed protein product [Owenia fusiformis]|uniref:Fibrinogen C-terminal domain-containing protein n=1 Tax=Owenia fusiformis TaxID=6347 RepID=A0A8S4NQF9_OWEFU|nr:unnamed protein product [Owenia fusiformis]
MIYHLYVMVIESIYFADCVEAQSRWPVPGVKNLPTWPAGLSTPMQARCSQTKTKILEYYNFAESTFVRPWQDYKTGFINNPDATRSNYFIGLDKLHNITSTRSHSLSLAVESKINSGFPETKYKFEYNYIHVANEQEQYKITLGELLKVTCLSKLNTEACLTDQDYLLSESQSYDPLLGIRGMKFSANDMDNDASTTRHCAEEMGGVGWWFSDCAPCTNNATDIEPYFGNIHRLCLPQMMYMSCPHAYCNSVSIEMRIM